MQDDLDALSTMFDIQIIGVNAFGYESGNSQATDGRDIPWLQDIDADNDGKSDVFMNSWSFRYRDVVIVDAANVVLGTFNLTDYNLGNPTYYNNLKSAFVSAASSPSQIAPPVADTNFDYVVDRKDIFLLASNLGDDTDVTRSSGDLNGDRSVDLRDLAKLRRHLFEVAIAPGGEAISTSSVIQAENFARRNSTDDFAWYLAGGIESDGVGTLSGMTNEDGVYLQALDAHQLDTTDSGVNTDGAYLEYGLNITIAGTYGLDLRVAGLSVLSDSIWAEIPTGIIESTEGWRLDFGDAVRVGTDSDSTFNWENAGLWQLDAGTHRIRLSMRESGLALDALRLERVVNSPAAAASIVSSAETLVASGVAATTDLSDRAQAVDRLFHRIGTTEQATGLSAASRRAVRTTSDTISDDGARRGAGPTNHRLIRSHRSSQRLEAVRLDTVITEPISQAALH